MKMKKKTICFVSGSRADFGLMHNLIQKMLNNKKFKLVFIVTGMHLDNEFGYSYKEILKKGIKISKKIKTKFTIKQKGYIVNSLADTLKEFNNYFKKINPDLICIPADRHEMIAPAIAAFHLNLPIAHFFGGEITNGSKDDTIRHCLTKLSNIHFVSHKSHKRRVMQLGENPKSVHLVGNMTIDNISKTIFFSKQKIEKKINYKFSKKTILVTYHPITTNPLSTEKELKNLLLALKDLVNVNILFTKPNNDMGSDIVLKMIKNFVQKNKSRSKLYDSLGHSLYYSLVKQVDCVVGNSSSGLTEVPFLGTPSINIGIRQSGRTGLANIININAKKSLIINGIKKVLSQKISNSNKKISQDLYFKKGATNKIEKILKKFLSKKIEKYPFYDYS